MNRICVVFALFLIFSLLSACTLPVASSGDIEVRFGRPSSGDVIMVGEPMDLLANGVSTDGDVPQVLFFANGSWVGTSPNHAGENISASYVWTPTEAGEYTLQVAAQLERGYVYSPSITVCVLPFQIALDHSTHIYSHGYEGDCVIPDRAASALPGVPTTTTVSANPEVLNYVPLYYEFCEDQTRFLNFEFYIDDPHDDIVFAAIKINMSPAHFGRISGETTLALTRVSDTPLQIKNFVGGMDMHIYLARSLVIPETGVGESGVLNWLARAFGRDGEILLEEGPFSIPVSPVNCDGSPYISTSASPISTIEQPTSTPASDQDCPPGTYYSDITHQCYEIAISTPKPEGGGNVCSQYTSSNACNAAGCNYDYTTKSCK